MENFNQYSRYYDLLYRDKDYKMESDYVVTTLKKHSNMVNSILDLGCGSGSHAFHICDQGIHVTGIERSNEMINSALKKNIESFEIFQSDISEFRISKKFDAAISLFHVLNYLTDNSSLLSCFKSVNEHLNLSGLFLFDIWYTPAVLNLKPETRIKRLEDESIFVTRISEPQLDSFSNVVNVNFEVIIRDKITRDTSLIIENHPMRHFSIPEIKLLANFTGFEFVHCEEFLTKNPVSDETWGICCILKKISNLS